VIINDNEEVDTLKHEQKAPCQQLVDIELAYRDIKSTAKAALKEMAV